MNSWCKRHTVFRCGGDARMQKWREGGIPFTCYIENQTCTRIAIHIHVDFCSTLFYVRDRPDARVTGGGHVRGKEREKEREMERLSLLWNTAGKFTRSGQYGAAWKPLRNTNTKTHTHKFSPRSLFSEKPNARWFSPCRSEIPSSPFPCAIDTAAVFVKRPHGIMFSCTSHEIWHFLLRCV